MNTKAIRSILVLVLVLGMVLVMTSAALAASPIFVRPGGDDTNCDGTANVDYPGSGGPGLACAVKTIQKGIDLVDGGGTVRVLPGTYNETAANRTLFDASGPYQFGLFIGQAKSGITVMGVTAGDVPITDPTATLATVNTNATNNFGYSGVFVEGDNVTLQGLKFGPNTAGDNKTIEIIGDAFVLKYSTTAIPDGGGAIYFGDWRFNTGTNTSHIQSYTVENNRFDDGTQVAFSSGAGFSGSLSARTIMSNTFVAWTGGQNWPHISFNGAGGVPWYAYPVGGAVIKDNSFTGSTQHIRARGNYTNSQMDWTSFWNDNDYDKAVVDLIGAYPPFDVRTFSYLSGSYTFTEVRRIGAVIQAEVDNAQPTDTVLVRQGVYSETVTINKQISLIGAGSGDSACTNSASGVTVITALTGHVVTLATSGASSANPLLLKNLRIQPVGFSGINSGGNISFVKLDGVKVVGTNPNTGLSTEVGLRIGTAQSLSNVEIVNSEFNCLHFGWYFAQSNTTPGTADGYTVSAIDVQIMIRELRFGPQRIAVLAHEGQNLTG